jgi:hypothetical protein
MGLFVSGSSLELSDVVMRDCHRGLVIRDSTATLERCNISAQDAGVFLLTSKLNATNTDLGGTFYSVFAKESQVDLTRCMLVGKYSSIHAIESNVNVNATYVFGALLALEFKDSSAVLHDSRIVSNVSCLKLTRSEMDIWTTSLTAPSRPGEVLEMSYVRLYNTSSPKGWFVFGGVSSVEIYWSHDVSAQYRWNGSTALGEHIAVLEGINQRPVTDFVLGLNGTFERLWLLEWNITAMKDAAFGPYAIRAHGQGIFGEMEAPGDQPFRGVIEVIDVSPPTVTIESPLDDWQLNSVIVPFSGSVHDLGSGISRVQYALDILIWSDLPTDDGSWELTLEIFDGNHSIRVRAEDLDGNRQVVVTNFFIDTVPPTAAIIHPDNWTMMANLSAIVEGFVLQDEGSLLDRFVFEGDPIELNSSGYFRVTVDLIHEGANTFVLEAYDVAGNRREISIVIVRDLTPPELLIDSFPGLTNQRELTLNVTCTDVHGVTVTLDGYHVASVENDTLDVELNLDEGPNRFILAAEDILGNRVEQELHILLDTLLNGTILAPNDNAELNNTTVMLELSTDPYALVRVLNHTDWTEVGANGTISLMLELEPEIEHLLMVEFRDEANNTIVQAVSVTCREPKEPSSTEANLVTPLLLGFSLGIIVLAITLIIKRRRSGD